MTAVEVPAVAYHRHELMRLVALRSYDVLDTAPDQELDVLMRCAAKLLGAPVAALVMVDYDREWLKASYGWASEPEVPRAFAICSDVVAHDRPMMVADMRDHPRYSRLAWVAGPAGLRAFIGVPISGPDGLPFGVLCVLDHQPRTFAAGDLAALTSLAAAIVALLEGRRAEADIMRRLSHSPSGRAATSVATPARIRAAVDDGEMEAYYQPIVGLGDRLMVSMEALVRWNVPGIGLITPEAFLPQVQRSPLLSQMITSFMLREACTQLARWRRAGADNLSVSVNVTGSDASSGALFQMVVDALRGAGLPPTALTVELTETVELHDRGVATTELGRLSDIGVRVALDDFGVGYSGLEFLGLLPVHGVKIDRSFVALLGRSSTMRAALDNVVALATSLHLDLTAEGVETAAQAQTLRDAGVIHGQGYYYEPAAPARRLGELLALAGSGRLPRLPAG